MGAEGADPQDRGQQLAVHRPHPLVGVEAGGTEVGLANGTEPALAAGRPPGKDHVISHLDVGDALPDPFDDPAALMPEQEGKPGRPEHAVLGGEIGMANPAGEDPHQHLVRLAGRRS